MECYETICKVIYTNFQINVNINKQILIKKIGTGFSDERLDTLFKFLSEHTLKEPLPEYKINDFEVDVWLEPCCVWEIKGADMQISPVYTAGIGDIDPKRVIKC